MIDNNLFVGNNITGSFKFISEPSKDIHDYYLIKSEKDLYLVNDSAKEKIRLISINDIGNNIVNNFSDDKENESIYRLERSGDIVIVILYTYFETKKLLPGTFIRIHLLRDVEKQICNNGIYDCRLNTQSEIIPFLRKKFINNKSIFVFFSKTNSDSFQMYGNKWSANVRMERPGIYVIDRIHVYDNFKYSYTFKLTQLYGDIDFILWNDSINLQGNAQSLQDVNTNEIFKAWDEYMEFENRLYENNLNDLGFIKYNSIDVDGDQIVLNLSKNIEEEKVRNIDFEFISSNNDSLIKFPNTVEEILNAKLKREIKPVFLGKCTNVDFSESKLIFNLPRRGFSNDYKSYNGILYISNASLLNEQKRRREVMTKLESKTNETANIIMRLSTVDIIDEQLGTNYNPIDDFVIKKMFGKPDVKLKETYRSAMSIALNTPDIALIQGPPGTGKTTLIKGLITKIRRMNNNATMLVSSEQHEALYNVVDKLSENKFIPPFVSSYQYNTDINNEDNNHFIKNVKEFQKGFCSLCKNILREIKKRDSRSELITECVYIIQDIRDNNYSCEYIAKVIDKLKNKIIALGYSDLVIGEFHDLYEIINAAPIESGEEELDFSIKSIIRKVEAQRVTYESFVDDGPRQVKELQRLLKNYECKYNDFLMPSDMYDILQSDEESKIKDIFDKYIEYVDKVKDKFIPKEKTIFDSNKTDNKKIIQSIFKKLSEASKGKSKDLYEIIEALIYRLNDIDAAGEIIKNYTSVIGSTCAQANRSSQIINDKDKFDYVIIDEAARANPLDIMIPMMMGIKVILIGDHKQLPHYIESNYLNKFKSEKERYSDFNEDLLTKSLFQIIYENLDKAYKDCRLKYRRTIQINEQYRMHPSIGTFISKEFYDDTILNGEKTNNMVNDYNVFNGKNVVWIQVKVFEGFEQKENQTFIRLPEVDRIISLIRKLVKNNKERRLNIGIISFYKGQVKKIKQDLEKNFPKNILDNIFCDTVDAYQGKEFDIVILSGVRCNNYGSSYKSLGFIENCPSRINVALSRAKRLLIVVADADTYCRNKHFRNFIEYVKKEGYYEQ